MPILTLTFRVALNKIPSIHNWSNYMKNLLKKLVTISPLKISWLVIIIVAALFIMNVAFFNFLELKSLDLRMISRGVGTPGEETLIAAVDEKSLSELGQWPWSRTVIARLIDTLREYGAKAVGFDVVFAEPDETSSAEEIEAISNDIRGLGFEDARVLRLLEEKRAAADTDAVLSEALRRAGNVILGYFFHTSASDIGHLSEDDLRRGQGYIAGSKYKIVQIRGNPANLPIIRAYGVVPNIEPLSRSARAGGYFNFVPDVDGTNRWCPLVIQFGDDFYPPLSIAVLQQYLEGTMPALRIEEYGVDGVALGNIDIPTNESGKMLINYLGPAKTFPHYSVTDILHGRLDPELFRGRIVLVGATATGIYDLRVTPYSPVYPGVEMHATVIDNILHGNFIHRPGWIALLDLLTILLLGLITGVLISRMRAVWGLIVCILILALYMAGNTCVFSAFNVWLNMVYPVLTVLAVYVGITVYKYVTEEREKKKIRGAFQYYLTASVINEMLKDPSKLKLGGDKKDLSVLFSDIRGFTSISEKLTPEDLVHLLNEYLTAMTDIVFKYDGLLDKYMGDAIMAVFGAPLDQPDHSFRACNTALDMMAELKKLQKKWEQEGRPVLDIGVGINSGDMVVGNMGSEMRFDYTVMGDSVNLGSRLEGINKEYGTNIVISEYTYEKVRDKLLCRQLDAVKVKGKALPVKIYELMGKQGEDGDRAALAAAFEKGLEKYRNCQWDEAIAAFEGVLAMAPGDGPSRLYISRCRELKENPPGDGWDGVFTMTRK